MEYGKMTYGCKVWDKLDKRMYPVRSIIFDDNQNIERVMVLKEEEDKTYLHEILAPFFILLPCVGMSDSTGKDIYKGDILTVNECDCDEDVGVKFTVEWADDYCGFLASYKESFEGNEYYTWSPICDYMTIIGNIYENPDILEEANGN